MSGSIRPYITSTLSFAGCSPSPQLPTTSVVIPCSTFADASGSTGSAKSPCECTSMNPGATTIPVASSTSSAFSVVSPTSAIRSPSITRSPRRAGAPVPSSRLAPVMSTRFVIDGTLSHRAAMEPLKRKPQGRKAEERDATGMRV